MNLREMVNLRKAYKKLGYKVGRSTRYGSQINSRGELIIARGEEDPLGRMRKWLPYAHQTAATHGFRVVDISGRTKMKKIERLVTLNQKLDGIIEFRQYDHDDTAKDVAIGGTGVAAGVGGLKLHQAVKAAGGWGANVRAARYGEDVLGKATGAVPANYGAVGTAVRGAVASPGKTLTAGAQAVGRKGLSALDRVLGAFKLARIP